VDVAALRFSLIYALSILYNEIVNNIKGKNKFLNGSTYKQHCINYAAVCDVKDITKEIRVIRDLIFKPI